MPAQAASRPEPRFASAVKQAEDGFIPLFNGKDLKNWTMGPENSWAVEDGLIALKRPVMDGKEHNADYLWTKASYADFVLELEFKTCDGYANSGVFLRTSDRKDPVYTGLEVQVSNSYGKPSLSRTGTAGAIYDCQAPTKNTVKKAGEWNQMQVTCRGSQVAIVLNGENITEMDLDRWTEAKKNPDGTPNKFPRPIKEFARAGYVGLQDHGRPVWYRNIRVKPLEVAAVSASRTYTLVPDQDGMVLKTPDGRTIFRYMTRKPADSGLKANSVCCLFPLNTPSGERVVDFAPPDHPHHRGVFLTWHAIDGKKPADFWGWGEWAPTKDRVIENRGVKLVMADAAGAEIAVRNDWVAEGETLVEENTTIAARQRDGVYLVDLDFRLTPKSDLTLRQTAFGGLCIKARHEGEGVYTGPQGEMSLPAPHHLKPESDWPAADWYDYTMTLPGGKKIGVAVMDHPGNPPSVWHNLKTIAMVNPCIVAGGPVKLKAGQPLRLRYRIVTHDGAAPLEVLKNLSSQWRTTNN